MFVGIVIRVILIVMLIYPNVAYGQVLDNTSAGGFGSFNWFWMIPIIILGVFFWAISDKNPTTKESSDEVSYHEIDKSEEEEESK